MSNSFFAPSIAPKAAATTGELSPAMAELKAATAALASICVVHTRSIERWTSEQAVSHYATKVLPRMQAVSDAARKVDAESKRASK